LKLGDHDDISEVQTVLILVPFSKEIFISVTINLFERGRQLEIHDRKFM